MTSAPEGRVITRVVCPAGHMITEVLATAQGLMLYAPEASMGAHARRGGGHDIIDRGRSGEMWGRLRRPHSGEFISIVPQCVSCGDHFQLSLDELWEWTTEEKRRVVALPRDR